jgi:hypothetical protein
MTVASTACVDHVVQRLPYNLAREMRIRGDGFGVVPDSCSPQSVQFEEIIRQPVRVFGT